MLFNQGHREFPFRHPKIPPRHSMKFPKIPGSHGVFQGAPKHCRNAVDDAELASRRQNAANRREASLLKDCYPLSASAQWPNQGFWRGGYIGGAEAAKCAFPKGRPRPQKSCGPCDDFLGGELHFPSGLTNLPICSGSVI